ncbi:hypothetical protein ACRAWD_09630 [Caulobacter segnis]
MTWNLALGRRLAVGQLALFRLDHPVQQRQQPVPARRPRRDQPQDQGVQLHRPGRELESAQEQPTPARGPEQPVRQGSAGDRRRAAQLVRQRQHLPWRLRPHGSDDVRGPDHGLLGLVVAGDRPASGPRSSPKLQSRPRQRGRPSLSPSTRPLPRPP